MISIEEIRTRESFEALRPEWRTLIESEPDSSPFDAPSWYACCLAAEPGRPLSLLAARQSGALVGIAPWWEGRARVRGIEARTVGFISNRETPRSGFVVRAEVRDRVVEEFLRHARTAWRARWDILSLAPWPVDAPDRAAFERIATSRGCVLHRSRASLVPTIGITASWDDFLAGKSYLFRKSRRGILNRMSRVPDVTVERHRHAPGPRLLEELADVSRRGWKHRDGVSLAAREDSLRFFAALNEAADAEGWLDVWMLRFAGVPVAFEYDLLHADVVHALRAEFDEAHERLSPGAYLEYFILKAAFDEGRRRYSCGPGLDAYKLRWTEELHETTIVRIYGPTPAGRWLEFLEARALPALRRVRDRLRPRERGRESASGDPAAETAPTAEEDRP
ncbi:MAG TPA: GNAT family N-acetyltransferase [Candidatus Eisenbacteria bacterium]|nr:GNAT family N-acetyltransferase [Candidatus Eisenbacteria bacterium]